MCLADEFSLSPSRNRNSDAHFPYAKVVFEVVGTKDTRTAIIFQSLPRMHAVFSGTQATMRMSFHEQEPLLLPQDEMAQQRHMRSTSFVDTSSTSMQRAIIQSCSDYTILYPISANVTDRNRNRIGVRKQASIAPESEGEFQGIEGRV